MAAMTEPLTGLDEAIEAAARAIDEYVGEGHPDWYEPHARHALEAAYPIIAAAARADERAKVLAEHGEALMDANPIITELRELWQRALEREGNLASAVADVVRKATQFGETEDGDTFAYIVPKGAMHRLVGVAQSNGAHVPVSFRAQREPTP